MATPRPPGLPRPTNEHEEQNRPPEARLSFISSFLLQARKARLGTHKRKKSVIVATIDIIVQPSNSHSVSLSNRIETAVCIANLSLDGSFAVRHLLTHHVKSIHESKLQSIHLGETCAADMPIPSLGKRICGVYLTFPTIIHSRFTAIPHSSALVITVNEFTRSQPIRPLCFSPMRSLITSFIPLVKLHLPSHSLINLVLVLTSHNFRFFT